MPHKLQWFASCIREDRFAENLTIVVSTVYAIPRGMSIAPRLVNSGARIRSARDISNMRLRRSWLLVGIVSIWSCASPRFGPRLNRLREAGFRWRRENITYGVRPYTTRNSPPWRILPHAANAERYQPPQALATPDPLLEEAELNAKVSVSFLIGTDGRVHSALILESAGPDEDRTILDAVASGVTVLPCATVYQPRQRPRWSFPVARKVFD